MYQIVMISGKQGSGKTTLQHFLAQEWQKRFVGARAITVNFADVLYEMHDQCLNTLHKYWPKRDIVKDGPLLQLLGTEWGRNTIDQDIWVKCLREKINILASQNSHYEKLLFIIGDCRFENEFNYVSEALRVRLEASEAVRKERVSMWRDNSNHPSEIGLDTFSKEQKFDLYLRTEGSTLLNPIAPMIELIIAQLQKNNWIEKRK